MPKIPLTARKADRYPLEARQEYAETLRHEMWDRGLLEYLTLPNAQRSMYRRAHQQTELFPGVAEPVMYLCHRQLGKTHLAILMLVEEGLRFPGSSLNYGTDTVDRAEEFFEEKLPAVIEDAPQWINIWRRDRTVLIRNRSWPRGVVSKIRLRGLDHRRGDRMRGGNTRMWVIDEAGYIAYLEHAIRHVITPMFRGQRRPRFLILTTPPENPQDHDLYGYYLRAEKRKSLVVWPASENPDWTSDDDRMMLAEYGSKQDVAWRRELECEMIADRTRLVVPEWGDTDGKYYLEVVEWEADKKAPDGAVMLPEHYRGYVTIDAGWKDYTAAVLSSYDFEHRRIVVRREVFVHYTPTHAFSDLLLEAITDTFPEMIWEELIITCDANELVVQDLNNYLREEDPRFFVSAVEKWDLHGALNNMRSGVQLGRIIVAADCVQTNHQLAMSMWNKKRTDFERSKALGHCDLLVAVNYQYRQIAWDENPRPMEDERPKAQQMVNPYTPDDDWNESIEAVQAIFDPLGRNKNGRSR